MSQENRLKITEIFYSIQGEAMAAGWPTVFIRLTGCPLRCHYCDSEYAFQGGQWLSVDSILQQVSAFDAEYVCVTGGEPLAQKRCIGLLEQLCERDYRVSLETSGALDLQAVDRRVQKVVDVKTPGSGEVEKNRWENLEYLTQDDQLKFVICSQSDYQWAVDQVNKRQLLNYCNVFFSPSFQQQDNQELADWILKDRLRVRMQIQMHKYIWGDLPGK